MVLLPTRHWVWVCELLCHASKDSFVQRSSLIKLCAKIASLHIIQQFLSSILIFRNGLLLLISIKLAFRSMNYTFYSLYLWWNHHARFHLVFCQIPTDCSISLNMGRLVGFRFLILPSLRGKVEYILLRCWYWHLILSSASHSLGI